MTATAAERALPYRIGLAVGVLAALAAVPRATSGGAGGLFAHPDGDLVTNLIGHLAFQAPGWHWPDGSCWLRAWS